MKKTIKVNYIYNLMYQIIVLLTPLITTPYLSRVLTPEGVGKYSFVESIVSYFTIFAVLGTTIYGQREIASQQDNKNKCSEIFWNIVCLRGITSAITIAIYMVAISVTGNMESLYYIFTLNIVSVALDITWFFSGMEEFGLIVLRNTIIKLCNIAMIFLFVHDINDLMKYAFIMLGMTLIGNVSLWPSLRKYVVKFNLRVCNPFLGIKDVISLFIPTIAIQIYCVLDKIIIGFFATSYSENAYYEQSMKIVRIVIVLVTSLGTVVAPKIAYYYANNEMKKIEERLYKSYRFVLFMACPMVFGLMAVSGNIVPWFFGEGYDKVAILLPILAWLILAIGISNVTGIQYLVPTRQQKPFTKSVVIGAIINLGLNLVLIPKYYAIGACITSVIAEVIITIVQLIYIRDFISVKMVIQTSYKYIISSIVMFVLIYVQGMYLEPSMLNSFLMIVSGGFLYVAVLGSLRDELLNKSIQSALRKVRNLMK